MNTRWFLLSAVDVAVCNKDAAARNKETSGGELSVSWDNTSSQALVKVDGADKDWRRDKTWVNTASIVYDRDNHDLAVAMLLKADWQRGRNPDDPR